MERNPLDPTEFIDLSCSSFVLMSLLLLFAYLSLLNQSLSSLLCFNSIDLIIVVCFDYRYLLAVCFYRSSSVNILHAFFCVAIVYFFDSAVGLFF